MMIVLIDFFEVEAELWPYIFSEALLEVSDLAGIFEKTAHASDNSTTFLQPELLLEEVGVCTVE